MNSSCCICRSTHHAYPALRPESQMRLPCINAGGTPFGIYVHWPFCAAKCPYCDFNSHVRVQIEEAAWAKAIECELAYVASELVSRRDPVSSIFFGGGTPSLMSGRSAGGVLDAIARYWPLAADVEITLEANPSSVEAKRFRDYR